MSRAALHLLDDRPELDLIHRRPHPEQHRTPLLSAVEQESRRAVVRAHCPGHQGGLRAHDALRSLVGDQVLAADVWLDTAHYDRVRREAEQLAARAWRGRRAWLLGNGSTAGNLAWLLATLGEGEPVVVGRDAHTSVLAGLVLSGARPVWVAPRLHPVLGLPLGVEADDVAAALRHSGAKQVILTSPGYAGICADVEAVIAAGDQFGAMTYVDQAWGAHLPFLGAGGPTHALDAGAAGCVVSVHKTGAALSSGAVLVAGDRADADLLARVDRAVRMTQTTSPLLPLLASVDSARRDFAVGGVAASRKVVARAQAMVERLEQTPGVQVVGHEVLGLPADRFDPVKLVVDVSGLGPGVTGWDVEAQLRSEGVPPEGADDRRIYAVLAAEVAGDTFAQALEGVARRVRTSDDVVEPLESVPPTSLVDAGVWAQAVRSGRQLATPRQAHHGAAHAVPLGEAVGRVAAEPVVPYPPGVPVLLPGEQIDASAVTLLRSVLAGGGHIHGCDDPSLATLRVLD